MHRIFLLLGFLLTFICSRGQSGTYEEDILRFLCMNGTTSGYDLAFNQLCARLSASYPFFPDSLQPRLRSEVFEPEAQRLITLMVPLYRKHFSHDEILRLIAFYESPAGAKFTGTNVALARDLVPVIRDWGSKLMQKATAYVEAGRQ